jgi:hypothetical protein
MTIIVGSRANWEWIIIDTYIELKVWDWKRDWKLGLIRDIDIDIGLESWNWVELEIEIELSWIDIEIGLQVEVELNLTVEIELNWNWDCIAIGDWVEFEGED